MNNYKESGKLIHKILEIYGKNYSEDKAWLYDMTKKIIAREEFLSEENKKDILDLAQKFLYSDKFEELFFGNIKTEVEVVGGNSIKRIDLLIEKEDKILIIDYKSEHEIPQQIPIEYLQQLANYKNLITPIYPGKKVICAIFWVRFLRLQEI